MTPVACSSLDFPLVLSGEPVTVAIGRIWAMGCVDGEDGTHERAVTRTVLYDSYPDWGPATGTDETDDQ